MLSFFHRHQKGFYIVVTFFIVVSFCFFGTCSAFTKQNGISDREIGHLVDGSVLKEQTAQERKTICLNMIVKNEKDVIERCLGSVKTLIDYWVIYDTGSTDGTQQVIRAFMKDIPGELHQSTWVNFEHNRNEALQTAQKKADYVLWIDADEILEYSSDFKLPHLEKDFYHMNIRQIDAAEVKRCALIKSTLNWKWVGVLHEVLQCPEAKTHELLRGVINICNTATGGRSKIGMKEKYWKDALTFEEALKKEPNNSRYVYYLGVSYCAAEHYDLALEAFKKRLSMSSVDHEETYRSMYTVGSIYEKIGNKDAAIEAYFQAHQMRPIRAEPLYRAAQLYRQQRNPLLGYLLSKYALSIPYPSCEDCIDYMAYEYAMLIEFANCSLLIGKWQEGFDACAKLLSSPKLPEGMKEQVESNYELAKNNLTKRCR